MFKYTLFALFITIAICYGEIYNLDEDDILLPAESLPPRMLVRFRRQLFGGRSGMPGGGFQQQVGYRGSVFSTPNKDLSAWGSLSQSANQRGFTSPITYGGGVDYSTAAGSGLSASALHIPRQGTQGTLSGSLNLVNTPDHKLNAFASHTKTFDPHFREIGRGSSTAGLGYQNSNGAQASLSGTHTPGLPNSASVAGSIPLFNSRDGRTKVDLNGQSTFTEGHKPNHQVGVGLTHNF